MNKVFEYELVIIGAGASGLFAASVLGRKGIKTAIIEANNKLGAKILQTGNGKCNFTNLVLDKTCYQNKDNDRAFSIIEEFNNLDLIEYFKSLGIYPKIRDGYVYPRSETAASIVNAFRLDLEASKVKQFLNSKLESIRRQDDYYILTASEMLKDKEVLIDIKAKYVIIATGSKAGIDSKKAGKELNPIKGLGIKPKKFLAALVALKSNNPYVKFAKGVRAQTRVKLFVDGKLESEDLGEVQYTDYGISGIPVFQISRYATAAIEENKNVIASIDILPEYSYEEVLDIIENLVNTGAKKEVRELFDGLINHKLMEFILKNIGFDLGLKACNLTKKDIIKIAMAIKDTRLEIIDSKGISASQVCQGGVRFQDLNDNLELKKIKNVFVVGEMVDVDAKCGGYNLQWAWSSAMKAAKTIIGDCCGKTSN